MDPINRRSFLAVSAGVVAGTAVASQLPASAIAAATSDSGSPMQANLGGALAAGEKINSKHAALLNGSLVRITNSATGEMMILGDDSEVHVVDRSLVAALGRAAAKGKRN